MVFTMTFRLQYASNLFVDLHKRKFDSLLRPAAAHLALLGNIGRPESPKTYHFLKFCSANWDSVVWIPGPHEISNLPKGKMTLVERTTNAKALARQFNNVSLMNSKERVFFDQRIVLVGTPLWTSLRLPPKGQPEFAHCFTSTDEAGPVPLTNSSRNTLHALDLQFLIERKLFWSIVAPQANLIFLTHTLPTPCLLRRPLGDLAWNRLRMDVQDHRDLMESPLAAWIGGATGTTQQLRMQGSTLACTNGLFEYPFDSTSNESYDKECVLEIDNPTPNAPMVRWRLPSFPSSLDTPNLSLLCS